MPKHQEVILGSRSRKLGAMNVSGKMASVRLMDHSDQRRDWSCRPTSPGEAGDMERMSHLRVASTTQSMCV